MNITINSNETRKSAIAMPAARFQTPATQWPAMADAQHAGNPTGVNSR